MGKIIGSALAALAALTLVTTFSVPASAGGPNQGTNRQAAEHLLIKATRDKSHMQPTFVNNLKPQVQKQYNEEFIQGLAEFNNGNYAAAREHFDIADRTLQVLPEWNHLK